MPSTDLNGGYPSNLASINKCCNDCTIEELCWDADLQSPCGSETTIEILAQFAEADSGWGDARIMVFGQSHLDPNPSTVNAAIWQITGTDSQGNPISENDQQYENWGDLLAFNSESRNINKITVLNTSTFFVVRIYGNLNDAIIDAIPVDNFFGFKRYAPNILQYNPKELYFYKDAVSDIVNGSNYVEFKYSKTYNAYAQTADQYWHEQALYKLANWNFNNMVWEKDFYYNFYTNNPVLTFTYDITFNNECQRKIITKEVTVVQAKYPTTIQNTPVITPITLSITDI